MSDLIEFVKFMMQSLADLISANGDVEKERQALLAQQRRISDEIAKRELGG